MKTAEKENDRRFVAMNYDLTTVEASVLPADILIRRVKSASNQNLFVNYFDVGIYPDAIRVYIKNEVVDFLMQAGIVQRLNTNLFVSRVLNHVQVNQKNKTLVVNAGKNNLLALIIRAEADIESALQQLPDSFLVDYFVFQSSDSLLNYICLFEYKEATTIEFKNLNIFLNEGGYDIDVKEEQKQEKPVQEQEKKEVKVKAKEKKEKNKPRLNKAGIPILD
ncbi:MAG: hypothetical protein ABIK73_06950 [candidate division WOR-3 bacterium]